jgi:hypothetical protein
MTFAPATAASSRLSGVNAIEGTAAGCRRILSGRTVRASQIQAVPSRLERDEVAAVGAVGDVDPLV